MSAPMLALRAAVAGLLLLGASGRRLRTTTTQLEKPYRQPLQNFQNTQYFADITIGGQTVKGIYDTGSFELLVRSTRCKGCGHPTRPYDYQKSKTYVKNGTLMKHVFGSGPCITMKGYDTVAVGPMEVKNQSFWEITQHQIPVLNNAKFAAIVGIGPHFKAKDSESTLLMSYNIDEFSVCLQREAGSQGYLTWGPVASDDEKTASFATVPVIGEIHWATSMTDVKMVKPGKQEEVRLVQDVQPPGHIEKQVTVESSVEKKEKPRSVNVCEKGCAAIVDSGTSLIAAPTKALVALSKVVGPIHEDCSNLHELPNLQFTLGDQKFELPPHAYVMRVTGAVVSADSVWDFLFFKPKIRKVNICVPAFMQMDMMSKNGPVWILGMPFFRYYHVSFNRKDRKMHFATAGQDCEPKPYRNGTALLSTGIRRADDFEPTDVDLDSILPPTLTSQLDDDEVAKNIAQI